MSTERQPWYTIKTRDPVDAVAEILWFRHSTIRTGTEDFLVEAREIVGAVVESIAAGFDTAAKDAAAHNKGPDRDIDVVLAWECAARWIREHAGNRFPSPQGATAGPGGTPGAPDPRDAVVDRAVEWRRRRSDRHATGMEFHAACRALADAVDALPATSPTGDPTP